MSGLGRSPGEGNGYPLQYSSLENSFGSQRVRQEGVTFTFTYILILLLGVSHSSAKKSPSAMQEMQALSLGWEDPLEKKMATHSRILAWEIPWTEKPDGV